MTNHVARLYATAGALAAFFLAWAGIAARPWVEQPRDPRLAALEQREQRLQRDATLVQQVERRWATYHAALAQTQMPAAAAPAPPVRVVTLPPVATTRSS